MKIRKLYIKNFKIFRDFKIDFTYKDKAQNVVAVAGINGSGKTTLFKDFIFETFSNYSIGKNNYVEIEYQDNTKQEKFTIDTNKFNFTDNKNKQFQDDILLNKFKNIIYLRAGTADKKTAKETIIKFVDNLVFEKDKKSSEAYYIIQQILDKIFHGFDLQIKFKGLDRNREVIFKNDLSDNIKIEELSAGEQELITKTLSLYLADIKNNIILIDEPEGSLHPKWQSRITDIYQEFANKNNNQIIFATHSPHIISSLKKEQIRVLIKDNKTIKVIDNFYGSYGWKIDKILLEIFRLNSLRTPIIENKLNEINKMLRNNEHNSKIFKEKFNILEKSIGFDDLDLALIRMEIIRKNRENESHNKAKT